MQGKAQAFTSSMGQEGGGYPVADLLSIADMALPWSANSWIRTPAIPNWRWPGSGT